MGYEIDADSGPLICTLSAKDRGATKNPVSDLELNLSKTATNAIKFYKIKF